MKGRELRSSFSFLRRNYGHWDVYGEKGRIFSIRGGPGMYFIRDERNIYEDGEPQEWPKFQTLGMCIAYLCEELMYENIAVDGDPPQVIESWNIPRRQSP